MIASRRLHCHKIASVAVIETHSLHQRQAEENVEEKVGEKGRCRHNVSQIDQRFLLSIARFPINDDEHDDRRVVIHEYCSQQQQHCGGSIITPATTE